MYRGKKNNHRGRGGGRGRGRGEPNHTVPTQIVPATATRRPYPHANAEIDAEIQQWPEPMGVVPGASENVNRGNGPRRGGTPRARSGAWTPLRGTESPRRGASTPQGRGRGRGRGRGWVDDSGDPFGPRRSRLGVGIGGKARAAALFDPERPLLRPVKFVRAASTPFLFQHSEDVLKPAVEVANATEASHVPTADPVAKLFQGLAARSASESDSESEHQVEDVLEEIDFADLGQIRAAVDAIAQDAATETTTKDVREDEDMEEVDFADLAAIRAKVDVAELRASSRDDIIQETFTGVYKQSKDATQVSSTPAVVNITVPSTPDDLFHLKPSTNLSTKESISRDQDAIIVEQESNGTLDIPIVEEPSLSTTPESDPIVPIPQHDDAPHDGTPPLFIIDTAPSRPRVASDVILVDRTGHGETLGDQDDERIVYVAPHPRSRCTSESPVSAIPRVKLPKSSMLTGRAVDGGTDGLRSPVREEDGPGEPLSLASLRLASASPTSAADDVSPPAQASCAKAARRRREKAAWRQRAQQRQLKRGHGFGAYGAIMSEAMLREEDERERRLPRWETRRKGESDLEWGTEGESDRIDDQVDAASDQGGMEVDEDIDVNGMRGFLKSMSVEGSRFVTVDDIEDEARMQRQDEDCLSGPDESSDEEDVDEDDEEDIFNAEEQRLIAEAEDDEDLSENSSDADLSPRSGFQARLRKIREQSRGRQPTAAGSEMSDEEEDEEDDILPGTHASNDEESIAYIQDLLEKNSHIHSGRDRKPKRAAIGDLSPADFTAFAAHVEEYLDDPEYTTPVNKKKRKKDKGKQPATHSDVDAEIRAQWERDRAKKAAHKRARAEARLLEALDPLSAGPSKASRKAMRAAARLDPSAALAVAPRAVVDAASLEAQMRRFVYESGDGGGRRSMALPPMDKLVRKMVHEMAAAFGIESVSKGKGSGRYATLIRTARTGVRVSEGKVRAIVARYGWVGRGRGEAKRNGEAKRGVPRHREGDEVGKEAPKIGASNVGFKMLASMGWSEGDRIGSTASVGLEAPLTAIMKHSKLGLGATRERERQ